MGPPLNLLVDTSTLIWAVSAPHLITAAGLSAIHEGTNDVFVSAASAWEIATKHRLGRLPQARPLVEDWDGELERGRFTSLDITHRHALRAGGYDIAHADPFDRIIAAQAELEELTVVAGDRSFDLFPVTRLW